MNSVNELAQADKVNAVLTAFQSYRTAVNQDELSRASGDARIPDAQVFYKENTGAVIIILPERHSSADDQVRGGALGVAKAVMAIPKVKIAVEEPINYNGTLLSNVGWAGDVTRKPQSTALFDFDADAQGSISHQIYVRQVGGMVVSTSRYAAEAMPRVTPRYNNPVINQTMVQNLTANSTKDGDISVFPVGPDHMSAAYDHNTLQVQLVNAGWTLLANH
ncbi:MAG TPA: hypothetical protein VKP60_12690 [Magnetospirillaceae bacterium]|nr:hypothetical protein [Magnetospirillaceae bacterium]